jgi:hypothetical protein
MYAGVGGTSSAAYTFPFTSADVENVFEGSADNEKPWINDWAAGLTPISPVIAVAPVVVIAVSANIAKLPAVPRLTGNGPAANAVIGPINPSAKQTKKIVVLILFLIRSISYLNY